MVITFVGHGTLHIDENLSNDVVVRFNKFRYGQENASCTKFMNEEKDLQRIDMTYLDEAFLLRDIKSVILKK